MGLCVLIEAKRGYVQLEGSSINSVLLLILWERLKLFFIYIFF